ncbi:MAG: hypothetical protein IKG21_09120 [Atopobiaceae bacterium]|nr:hypothetical protein [Atopobiaceae bacterium]
MEAYDYLQRGSRPGPVDNLNQRIQDQGYLVENSWNAYGDGGWWNLRMRPEDAIRDLAQLARELLDDIRLASYRADNGSVKLAALPDIDAAVDKHALAIHFVHEVRPRTAQERYEEQRRRGVSPIKSCIITRHPRGSAREVGPYYDRAWRQRHGDVR